jgi:3-oxoacyl-[acyl-carrier-protein] synthase-3
MTSIRILGTGSYVPPKRLTNFDLEKMGLDTSDEWIVQRTGVKERRVADPDVNTSDLGYEASLKALEMAGMSAKDLDLIMVATITPDTCCPSAANWLQAKLDAPQAVTFDVTAACSGFIFGLNVATQYLNTGYCHNILVVASEVMTRTLDYKDRSTCILWGDGAGAAILNKSEGNHKVLSTHIHSDGKNGQDLLMPGGGSMTTPISHESVDKGLHYLNMIEANASFRVNLRMFQSMAKSLKIPMDKFYVTLNKYGNISSASCAISLDEAVRDGSVKEGDLICMPVFGGGLTWGSALIRW